MIFDFSKVKISSYEFETLDVFAITLVSELTRIFLSMNVSSNDDSILTTSTFKTSADLLKQNIDAIIDVKDKLALITSSFKHSTKAAQVQARLPASNCNEFLALVTQCKPKVKLKDNI